MKQKKRIVLLGSTGSVGENVLSVVRQYPQNFTIVGLVAHSRIERIEEQIKEFCPEIVAIFDKEQGKILQKRVDPSVKILLGEEGVNEVAIWKNADLVVSAMSGSCGLAPTLAAIDEGKDIALANKEVLVSAGELVMKRVLEKKVTLLPVDSEHSAIFQCLRKERPEDVSRLILTASGGPFRNLSIDELNHVTPEDAMRHPTYRMGAKITVDSSTLMNKGLEVIEAHYLFGVPCDKIAVLVHPQSVIHSMVEFKDGSVLSQMSVPDMKVPIGYALHYPHRVPLSVLSLDLASYRSLDFFPVDMQKFPCLGLAYEALRMGKSMPCFMNAANEVLVQRFLSKEIQWKEIFFYLEKLMSSHVAFDVLNLDSIFEVDRIARIKALEIKRTQLR